MTDTTLSAGAGESTLDRPPSTAPVAAPDISTGVHVTHLARLERPVLDEVFAGLGSAHPSDLVGLHRVGLVSAPGVDRLPIRWKAGALTVLNAGMPLVYRGKDFDGSCGANVFVGGLRLIHCSLRDDPLLPGSLLVDYEVESNPRAVHPMAAEVRAWDDQTFLCRTIWRVRGGGIRRILYFTLTSTSSP